MKPISLFFMLFPVLSLTAQTRNETQVADILSMVRKTGEEYSIDFKHMRGKLKAIEGDNYIYYSRYRMPGSFDSSNLVYHNKVNKNWYFTADLDREAVSISELISIISQLSFSFGSLKTVGTEGDWLSVFVPASKRKASEHTKLFHIALYDGNRNPADAQGKLLRITIGANLTYRDN